MKIVALFVLPAIAWSQAPPDFGDFPALGKYNGKNAAVVLATKAPWPPLDAPPASLVALAPPLDPLPALLPLPAPPSAKGPGTHSQPFRHILISPT